MQLTAIATWFALSVAIEFLIDILKQAFPFLNTSIKGVDNERVMAIVLGLLICFGANINFFELFGINYTIPYIGYIFGAMLIAGGSAKLHDFVKAIGAAGSTPPTT